MAIPSALAGQRRPSVSPGIPPSSVTQHVAELPEWPAFGPPLFLPRVVRQPVGQVALVAVRLRDGHSVATSPGTAVLDPFWGHSATIERTDSTGTLKGLET